MLMSIRNICKDFGGVRALNQVNVDINRGELLGLIGPNGSGKTTLFNVITGFLKPDEGEVIYMGKPITNLQPHEIVGSGIARTFQLSHLFENLTVKENVVGAHHLKASDGLLDSFIKSKTYNNKIAVLEQRAGELLKSVHLEDKMDTTVRHLSYGDQRKLELVLALTTQPDLLLLDEPATGMNASEVRNIMNIIREISQKGVTIVIVEHNMKVVMEISTRVVVLEYGAKIAEGTPAEVARNEKVISIYLGKRVKSVKSK